MRVPNLRAKVLQEIKQDLAKAKRENRAKQEESKEWLRIQNLKGKDENAYYDALANFEEKKLRKRSSMPEISHP